MLTNFIIALNTVLPIFIIIGLGYLAKRLGMINAEEIKRFNKIAFMFFGPCMMFANIYGKDIKSVWDGKLILYCIIAELIIYGIAVVFVISVEKNPKSRGALIHAIFRSNSVLMGVPIAISLLGESNTGIVVMVLAIFVPMQNFLAVLTLEVFRGGKPDFKKVLKGIATNPFILGSLAGLICVIWNITLPQFMASSIKQLGNVMTPLALFLLGCQFHFDSPKRVRRNTTIAVIARLIVVPAIGVTTGALLGFTGAQMVAIVAVFSAPTAVTTFTMAQQMDSDAELAGNIVVYSALFSLFTLTGIIMLVKTLGLI